MVGTPTVSVRARAASRATISRTTANAPASSRLRASSSRLRASSAVRPRTLYPPESAQVWGSRPMWPITGTPASAMARTAGAMARPPSTFTASAPAPTSLPALRTAACAPGWYDMNGMSATTMALFLARATADVNMHICPTVAPAVPSWPRTTMAALSPTSSTSMPPAPSHSDAKA